MVCAAAGGGGPCGGRVRRLVHRATSDEMHERTERKKHPSGVRREHANAWIHSGAEIQNPTACLHPRSPRRGSARHEEGCACVRACSVARKNVREATKSQRENAHKKNTRRSNQNYESPPISNSKNQKPKKKKSITTHDKVPASPS